MKKLIAAAATVFIAVALSVAAVATPASAHTAHATGVAVCNSATGSATVTWTVVNDYNEVLNVSASDNAAIPVGTTLAATGGGADTTKTFTQQIPAPAAGVVATATLSFLWSGDNFTQNGSKYVANKVSADCTVPTPADAAANLVVTPATCSAPATVTEGTTTFATWNGAIAYSGTGNLHYSVTATATGTHVFPAGANVTANGTKLTLSGNLDAKLTGISCQPPVCIPNSAVSYHYNANDNNDGYIVVNDVPHSTGQLCNPFWVTATSWKFTNNSSIWPQTRDVVDKLGKISAVGTYDFAAKVTCGQGDIYASFSESAPSLNPGPVLNNPGNPFAEHFLSDMGFSGSASPTYTQDGVSCFIPTPETGSPVSTVLSCTPGTANSLTLPAVPGGVWTVTSANYSHTYGIGTGITGFTPTVYEKYTIVLTDGSSTDGYTVTGNTNYWTPVNPTIDCNTLVTPVKPDVNPVEKCGVDGSFTVPTTAGVNYYLGTDLTDPLVQGTVITGSGTQIITATPTAGNEFSTNPEAPEVKTFTLELGSEKTCTVTIVLDKCTADGPVSTVPVSVTLDNSSGTSSSSFEVKIEGTTYDHTFVVDAGNIDTKSIGTAPTTGETVDVFINGATTAVVLTVDKFDGCVPVTPGDPTSTPLTCSGPNQVLGSISTDGNPELIYTLHGPTGFTDQVFPSLPATPTISGLEAGDYSVTVTAQPGFVLTGDGDFPFTITLAAVDCSQLVPAVSSISPTCTPTLDGNTTVRTTGSEVNGSITITPADSRITYTINDGTGAIPITAGKHIEGDGSYTIVATLTPAAVAAGVTFDADAGYTRSANNTVATWEKILFTDPCDLPTLPVWHDGATSTDAVCTAHGALGTITVTHFASEVDSVTNVPEVSYSVENDATHHVTSMGTSISTISVGPGHYTVTASVKPGDGVVGGQLVFHLTIAAAAAICGGDTSLAFTGGTIAWFGFVLAGGMLFLGIAFMLVRRRNNRTAQ